MTQVRVGWRAYVNPFTPEDPGTPNTIDQDVTNFILASGISDSVQTSAIETLVSDLKSYGLWTKMKAIYPFVGGSAASHKWNLKDPRDLDAAYRLVFNGGWVHSSNGALPNGTTGYADTKFIPSTNLGAYSVHLSYYSRTNRAIRNSIVMGAWQDAPTHNNIHIQFYAGVSTIGYSGSGMFDGWYGLDYASYATTRSDYFLIGSKTAINLNKVYENGVLKATSTITSTRSLPNVRVLIGAEGRGVSGATNYDILESAFASIGDGLSDTEAANFYIAIQKFQTTLGRHVGTPYVSDPDAVAFLTAAGITDGTQAAAINTLVTRMKADGVWTKMKAVYPFVGGSATSHKFNLKDPRDLDAAYRLVFSGGWIHSSTGAKPNGTTGYADTKLAPNVMAQNSIHASFYSRTDITGSYWDLGAYNAGGGVVIGPRYQSGTSLVYMNIKSADSMADNNPTIGLYMGNRTSSTSNTLFRNGVIIVNGSKTSFAPISLNIYLGADNEGTILGYSPREQAFASIGDGLTDTEASNFYNSVQAYQTTLGRQVSIPVVSDTDAQSFLNAANITSFQQASAVNKLVVDLKAAGVWTKMKAIYPFVGGSAASHKFNLKDPRDLDAAYRLVFNGGWTHTGTGALPNGTTGFADTKLKPTDMAQNSAHMSTYLRTQLDNGVDMGVSTNYYFFISANQGASLPPVGWLNLAYPSYTGSNLPTQAFYLASRTNSTTNKLFRNTSLITNITSTSSPQDVGNIYLGAGNRNNSIWQPSSREQAFTSIGDGLTDGEATAFYTAVQTYQTSLGRAVNTPVYNNGLVLNLDAGNANSYPGTGTTWFDLASGNNGTLVNGPTYDITNGGSIVFDGVNDYLDLGTLGTLGSSLSTNSITMEFVFKSNYTAGIRQFGTINTGSATLLCINFNRDENDNYSSGKTTFSLRDNNGLTLGVSMNTNIYTNNYFIVAVSRNATTNQVKFYVNGLPVNVTVGGVGFNSNPVTFSNFQYPFLIGAVNNRGSIVNYTSCSIPSFKIYNRILTDTEVLNNFNSTRGRFGL